MQSRTTNRITAGSPALFRPVLALVAIGCLAGCAGRTTVDGAWSEGVARQGGFSNILVVGVSPDVNQRCAFEQSMTANLRSDSVKATTSCAAMGTKVPLTRENVELAVARIGADAVLATTLVQYSGKAKEGGSADARGAGYYKATGFGYDSGYYGAYGVPVVYGEFETAPSVFSIAGGGRLTTNIFETGGATLVYSMNTTAKNLESRDMALAEISPAIAAQLLEDGVIR